MENKVEPCGKWEGLVEDGMKYGGTQTHDHGVAHHSFRTIQPVFPDRAVLRDGGVRMAGLHTSRVRLFAVHG